MPPLPTRPRSAHAAHQEAVARRLAELSAQLAAASEAGTAVPGLEVPGSDELEPEQGGVGGSGEWWSDHTRVPAPASPPPRAAPRAAPRAEPVVATAVEPGRHASRRPSAAGEALGELLPATFRERLRFGAAQVGVVATLVAVGLAFTLWSLVRAHPSASLPAGAQPALADATLPGPTSAASPTLGTGLPGSPPTSAVPVGLPSTGASTTVTVDVAGKVRRPGIVVLPSGDRVADALRKAGGVRHGVDLTSLNLARPLVDGEQILVGVKGVVADATPSTTSTGSGSDASDGATASPSSPVDLNTADETELETLPDVGPVTAGSILAYRQAHGSFTSVDELLEVDGIGDATHTLEPIESIL